MGTFLINEVDSMENFNWRELLRKTLSHLLVAVLASVITIGMMSDGTTKLTELQSIIDGRFIGEADMEKVQDAAAQAMVAPPV